jgi:hypothetical protein
MRARRQGVRRLLPALVRRHGGDDRGRRLPSDTLYEDEQGFIGDLDLIIADPVTVTEPS